MPIQKKELRVLNKKGDCQRDSVLKSADKKGKKEYRATIKTKILKREPVLECSTLACLLVCHPVCASASSRALIMRPRLARTCALANMQRHTLVHTHWKLTSRISLTQRLIVPLTNSGTRHWPAALSHSSKCLVMQLLKCHPVWTEEHSRTLRLTFTLSFWIFYTNLSACPPPPHSLLPRNSWEACRTGLPLRKTRIWRSGRRKAGSGGGERGGLLQLFAWETQLPLMSWGNASVRLLAPAPGPCVSAADQEQGECCSLALP